jgi:adenosylcobinamide kinase/adenosylcobinamide-phosphate guanylyltransferase
VKTLFIGGVKSGKSCLAEDYILKNFSSQTTYYLATTQLPDVEMQQRIQIHKQRRRESFFITIEEPLKLYETLKSCNHPVLVECVTMWLNNALYHQISEKLILQELEAVMQLPNKLVFVHNEVGFGIIPDNEIARRFVDLSGKAAQIMAKNCDEVFFCSAGLKLKMK